VLTSADGRILWYSDGYANGWPSVGALEQQVRAALSRPAAPRGSAGTGAVRSLARGASALAAVYRQAGQLLGPGLQSRLRALRGHPVVVNVWASYCGPCRQEFGLLQRAAARFGRRVAFLGADYQDNPSDARSFLGAHPTLYPSYAASVATIDAVLPAGILGLPTTFFVDRSGRVVHVQSGQYVSQGTLDGDVQTYAR
jgi:thiol-disulfide isomerase/thioredoxin